MSEYGKLFDHQAEVLQVERIARKAVKLSWLAIAISAAAIAIALWR